MADLKELSRQAIALYNAHDLDGFVARYRPDAELVAPGAPPARGTAAIKEVWQRQFAGFPDGRVTVHTMVAEGSTLAAEYTFTGTNTGPLTLPTGQTLPATNKKVSLRGVYVVILEGDKVKSDHSYWDLAEGLAQLGLVPTPARATA
jgi:steroid delta-isomerase-like uncharacterized protein